MAQKGITLRVVWRDASQEDIANVTEYGLVDDSHGQLLYYIKNNYRGFVAVDAIRFFGKLNSPNVD